MSHSIPSNEPSPLIAQMYSKYPDMTSTDGRITDGVFRGLTHTASYEYSKNTGELTIDLTGAPKAFVEFIHENITNRKVDLCGGDLFELPSHTLYGDPVTLSNGLSPECVTVFSDKIVDLGSGELAGTQLTREESVSIDHMALLEDADKDSLTYRVISTKSGEIRSDRHRRVTQSLREGQDIENLVELHAKGLYPGNSIGLMRTEQLGLKRIIPRDGTSQGLWTLSELKDQGDDGHSGDEKSHKWGEFMFLVPCTLEKAAHASVKVPSEGDV